MLCFGARALRGNLFGRFILWPNTGIIVIVPATAIGVMEGGHNHLLKTVVYFVGGGEHYRQLFPTPPYEVPSDAGISAVAELIGATASSWGAKPKSRVGAGS